MTIKIIPSWLERPISNAFAMTCKHNSSTFPCKWCLDEMSDSEWSPHNEPKWQHSVERALTFTAPFAAELAHMARKRPRWLQRSDRLWVAQVGPVEMRVRLSLEWGWLYELVHVAAKNTFASAGALSSAARAKEGAIIRLRQYLEEWQKLLSTPADLRCVVRTAAAPLPCGHKVALGFVSSSTKRENDVYECQWCRLTISGHDLLSSWWNGKEQQS